MHDHPATPATTPNDYPVSFGVEYPDRELNRLTTAFRIFTVIPIGIVLAAVVGGGTLATAGVLFLPMILMLLFREKYPRWWFDWNRELMRFTNRVYAYAFLMNDQYPSTDEHQYVRLDFPYPDAKQDLNRWLPLVKWFLAIPHYIVLFFLWFAARRADHRLVRDPVHRALPEEHVRVRRGSHALDEPRARLRLRPGHGSLPAVPAEPVEPKAAQA